MKRSVLLVVFAMLLTMAIGVATAQAAVEVSIDPSAKRTKGGKGLTAQVTVTCDPGLETLEGHLTVTQDDQRITGTGGLGVLTCDATPHVYSVQMTAQGGRYHRGDASASAFVLLLDPGTGTTQQGQASRTITVR